jgi:ER membrane protein complex subunit 2
VPRKNITDSTQVSSRLLPLIPEASKTPSKDSAYGDLLLPTEGTVKALHELATSKLAEIVRRGSAGENGWDGYDEAELKAARELLNRGSGDVQR